MSVVGIQVTRTWVVPALRYDDAGARGAVNEESAKVVIRKSTCVQVEVPKLKARVNWLQSLREEDISHFAEIVDAVAIPLNVTST